LLISHAGGGHPVNNITLSFDDTAASSLPNGSQMTGGTFKPTAYGGVTLPVPAPPPVYGSALTAVNGRDPNGVWSLYVFDDSTGDAGNIAGGWTLTLTTVATVNPVADLTAPTEMLQRLFAAR